MATAIYALESDRTFLKAIRRARRLALQSNRRRKIKTTPPGANEARQICSSLSLSQNFDNIPAPEIDASSHPDRFANDQIDVIPFTLGNDFESEVKSFPLDEPMEWDVRCNRVWEESHAFRAKSQKEFCRVTRRARRMAKPTNIDESHRIPLSTIAAQSGVSQHQNPTAPWFAQMVFEYQEGMWTIPSTQTIEDGAIGQTAQSWPFNCSYSAPEYKPLNHAMNPLKPATDVESSAVPLSAFHIPGNRRSLQLRPPPNLSNLRSGEGLAREPSVLITTRIPAAKTAPCRIVLSELDAAPATPA